MSTNLDADQGAKPSSSQYRQRVYPDLVVPGSPPQPLTSSSNV